jgi:hypothetical protein
MYRYTVSRTDPDLKQHNSKSVTGSVSKRCRSATLGFNTQILRIPGVANDEGAEDGADTRTGSGDADSGGPGTDKLGGRVDIPVGGRGLQGADLLAQITNVTWFLF